MGVSELFRFWNPTNKFKTTADPTILEFDDSATTEQFTVDDLSKWNLFAI